MGMLVRMRLANFARASFGGGSKHFDAALSGCLSVLRISRENRWFTDNNSLKVLPMLRERPQRYRRPPLFQLQLTCVFAFFYLLFVFHYLYFLIVKKNL